MLNALFLPLSVRVRRRPAGSALRARLTRLSGLLAICGGLLLSLAAPAAAQRPRPEEVSMAAAYVGTTTGGDTNTNGFTFGLSTAYVGESNWGGELDLSHSTSFNKDFEDSALTTLTVNIMFAPRVTQRMRAFVLGGGGLIRTRGCTVNCVREVSETDFGIDAGGGVLWSANDAWGLRGDVRYFRYVNTNRDVPRLDNGPFDFWRISIGGTYSW